MKRTMLIAALLVSLFSQAQYRNDNVLFQTVDVQELCRTLAANADYLLLDVRSPGEHDDTSFSVSLNIGRLKGAKNIPVQDLGSRIHELDGQKDKPVFVYCSHSQRSRRASKMLADSGFTKVFNINGGLTALHASGDDCIEKMFESNKAYNVISAPELCELLTGKKNEVFILDVRPDSAWQQISRFERENAIGSIRGAVHIARKDLPANLEKIPRDKQVIITEIGGVESALAAALLSKFGFTNLSVLLEGVDRFMLFDEKELTCKSGAYVSKAPYSLMNAFEFGRYVKQAKNFTILDIRSREEFTNQHKDQFRNVGRINNAINIPHTELEQKLSDIPDKNKPIIVYAFGGGPEGYVAARKLTDAGYKNVTVLMGGIFSLRWTAANRKDQAGLKDLVIEIPEANL